MNTQDLLRWRTAWGLSRLDAAKLCGRKYHWYRALEEEADIKAPPRWFRYLVAFTWQFGVRHKPFPSDDIARASIETRELFGLTQQDLANVLGVNLWTLQQIERKLNNQDAVGIGFALMWIRMWGTKMPFPWIGIGGPERVRTADPLLAKQALSR